MVKNGQNIYAVFQEWIDGLSYIFDADRDAIVDGLTINFTLSLWQH